MGGKMSVYQLHSVLMTGEFPKVDGTIAGNIAGGVAKSLTSSAELGTKIGSWLGRGYLKNIK